MVADMSLALWSYSEHYFTTYPIHLMLQLYASAVSLIHYTCTIYSCIINQYWLETMFVCHLTVL